MSCNVPPLTCEPHRVLFGQAGQQNCAPIFIDGCFSPIFRVDCEPIIIRAYGMANCEKIYLEMVGGPDDVLTEIARKECGCPMVLTKKMNSLVVPHTGVYRLNRCVCTTEPMSDAHVEYTYLKTPVSSACSCSGGKPKGKK